MFSPLVGISKQQIIIHKHRQTCAGTCFRTHGASPSILCGCYYSTVNMFHLSSAYLNVGWVHDLYKTTIKIIMFNCNAQTNSHVHRRAMEEKKTRHTKSRIAAHRKKEGLRHLFKALKHLTIAAIKNKT